MAWYGSGMKIFSLLFWGLILFDGEGSLDHYWAHGLVKLYARSEAIRLGYFYPWDLDYEVDPVHEVRKAFRELRLHPHVPPDEANGFVTEHGNDETRTSFYRMLHFNMSCQQALLRRIDLVGEVDEAMYDMLEELQKRHRIYDLLDDLNRSKYKLWQKRLKCHDLKELLKPEDYLSRCYPAIVPVERFVIRD